VETIEAIREDGETLKAAIAYSRRGWHVFPTKPDTKYPATAHGVKDASIDPDVINAWWGGGNLERYGIAIACGIISGIVVVDVDTKKLGLESFDRLTSGEHINTPTARTPSGGLHLFFKYPDGIVIGNSVSRVGSGIDIRSSDGYVVAAPTVLPTGKYKWEISAALVGLATLPAWALDTSDKPSEYQRQGIVHDGQGRNVYLTSWAGKLRNDGVEDFDTMYALLTGLSETRCSPPLEDEKVKSLAGRAIKWQPLEPRPKLNSRSGARVLTRRA